MAKFGAADSGASLMRASSHTSCRTVGIEGQRAMSAFRVVQQAAANGAQKAERASPRVMHGCEIPQPLTGLPGRERRPYVFEGAKGDSVIDPVVFLSDSCPTAACNCSVCGLKRCRIDKVVTNYFIRQSNVWFGSMYSRSAVRRIPPKTPKCSLKRCEARAQQAAARTEISFGPFVTTSPRETSLPFVPTWNDCSRHCQSDGQRSRRLPGTGRIKGDGQSKRIRHAILEKRAANLNFFVCENAGLKLDTVFRETSLPTYSSKNQSIRWPPSTLRESCDFRPLRQIGRGIAESGAVSRNRGERPQSGNRDLACARPVPGCWVILCRTYSVRRMFPSPPPRRARLNRAASSAACESPTSLA